MTIDLNKLTSPKQKDIKEYIADPLPHRARIKIKTLNSSAV